MISPKQADRLELLKDANYFAGELVTRLERLLRIEPHEASALNWEQAIGMTCEVRALVRWRADEQRRKANRKAAA